MIKGRYIIVNTETGIIDGLYLDRAFAEKSADKLRELWSGSHWDVEETLESFPIPGRVCLGHVRATGILKQFQCKLAEYRQEASRQWIAMNNCIAKTVQRDHS